MNEEDLAALLENNFLASVRTVTVLFVASIALFSFTSLGKTFSIISLSIALVLLFALVADYFIERNRIAQQGFFPRAIVDIIAFALVGVVLLLLWILYEVYNTEQTSLSDLAKEVEKEVERANTQLVETVKNIENAIISTNKDLIESIRNINNPNYVPHYESYVSEVTKTDHLGGVAVLAADYLRQKESIVNDAALAAVA